MPPPRIYLSPPHMCGKELTYVQQAFASNWIAPVGPFVDSLEADICRYTGANAAVALSSGTAAIHLSLILAGVAAGDEVLCSTFTFAGSAFPILYVGAVPVFIDSEEASWNMSPELLERAIKERRKQGKNVKACIVVHLYGQPADMGSLVDICRRYDIALIEDAAESLGAFHSGNHTGTIAPLGILSLNGNKIITSSGGGVLLGQDTAHIHRARFLATQARDEAPHYEHSSIGYNYRMSNVVAAVGKGQLTVIEDRVARKRAIFAWYKKHCADISGIHFMPEPEYGRSNRWLTCIVVDPVKAGKSREDIRLALEKENIESRPLWKPMHLQPVFAHYPAYTNGVSQHLFEQGLCLPSGTALSKVELQRIVRCIRASTSGTRKKGTRNRSIHSTAPRRGHGMRHKREKLSRDSQHSTL